jgi:hypothetical protein
MAIALPPLGKTNNLRRATGLSLGFLPRCFAHLVFPDFLD